MGKIQKTGLTAALLLAGLAASQGSQAADDFRVT